MKKLAKNADLTIYREHHSKGNHYWISNEESKEVRQSVNDTAFVLYSHLKMLIAHEANDISDEVIAKKLQWDVRKVADYRRELVKAELILFVKKEDYTLLFIGGDRVALYKAGLPANITDNKAFMLIKKKLKIENREQLISRIHEINEEYHDNYELYSGG
jgi:hypothetical protein